MFRWTLLIVAAFASTGCFNSLLLTPTNSSGPVEETVITDPEHWYCRDKVAIIDVEGLIMNARSSGMFGSGDNPLSLFRERLDAAADDKHVKAVVLRINSPGGAVTASDIMYQEVLSFRHDTHKPVVACMMDVAASGAYYLAMGCDKVYAHPTTVTGSIGVIMSLYNASGLFAKIGVSSDPIKSGPNKDIGNPGRPMTPEEHAILQGLVNSFYDQFVHVVAEGRRMPEDHVRTLADGRVYTGTDAQKLGLVDVVGYLRGRHSSRDGYGLHQGCRDRRLRPLRRLPRQHLRRHAQDPEPDQREARRAGTEQPERGDVHVCLGTGRCALVSCLV